MNRKALATAFPLSLMTAALLLAGPAQAQPAPAKKEALAAGLIIKFREGVRSPVAAKAAVQGFRAMGEARGQRVAFDREGAFGVRVIRMQEHQTVSALQRLARDIQASDATIESIEVDHLVRASFIPNDSRWADQWDLSDPTGGINAPKAWDISQGSGSRVAVLDTGVLAHADIAANLLPGYDMISNSTNAQDGGGRDSNASDPGDWAAAGVCGTDKPAQNSSWHGTHVAGTIAAVGNNSAGISGVAPKAKIVPVRVLGRCGIGASSDVADGIVWAVGGQVGSLPLNANPVRILNLSLGSESACGSTMQTAIDYARGKDALVVVAAGNDGQDANLESPANCKGVMAVAATNKVGGRSSYSNFGSNVDIAAPGGDATYGNVLSLSNTGTMGPVADAMAWMRGTSMAAPHVAGVAALMLATNSLLKADDTEYLMKATARKFPGTCSGCGTGILDAEAAVSTAKGFRYEIEPNNSIGTAQYLNLNWPSRVVGTLDPYNISEVDVYSVYLPPNQTLRTEMFLVVNDGMYTPATELLDASGKVLGTSRYIYGKHEVNYRNTGTVGKAVYLRVKLAADPVIKLFTPLYDLKMWRQN
ncbi:serine protease [Inhella inkyongensis]|uniref:Serine protease n=1 Tax=Inhella inkyongensis TaxID=392593 RepID=A0A840S8G9_9BURK|nr:S8 family peptidase [Inhella inkyongensis]MBB5205094.1 serine protease [Inhella inkyongensis]